jgi:outer membrane protein assembly factor BamB
LFLESTPAIADDGTIYIGSFSEEGRGAGLYAISSSGKIKWHFTTPSKEVMSTPSIGKDGTIYVGGYDDNTFYALNPDGTEKWSFKTGGATIGSSPAIGADGTIYVGVSSFARGKPGFYAFNPDGTVKWGSLPDSSIVSSPAIGADGTIYVGSWDKKLYAFGGSPAEESQVIVESKEEVTTDEKEEVIQTEKPKQETASPEKKGVCGPTALLALAMLPLWVRRLMKK